MRLTKEWVRERLPVRSKDANKGTFGKVLIIAGSESFVGAPYLAAAAAYRVGAGLVTLATISLVQKIIGKKIPEVTFLILPEENGAISNLATGILSGKLSELNLSQENTRNIILIGPGLTKKPFKFVNEIFKLNGLQRLLIDGDGLNILSEIKYWWKDFKRHDVKTILTPHLGEMARLTGLSIDKIKQDRLNIARSYATKWRQVLVLKGANTVIASPVGEILVSPFANPVLSTAGTGDVLVGIIAGLMAQGLKPFDASGVGVYLQGLGGEMVSKEIGHAGMLASDLLPLLPKIIKKLGSRLL